MSVWCRLSQSVCSCSYTRFCTLCCVIERKTNILLTLILIDNILKTIGGCGQVCGARSGAWYRRHLEGRTSILATTSSTSLSLSLSLDSIRFDAWILNSVLLLLFLIGWSLQTLLLCDSMRRCSLQTSNISKRWLHNSHDVNLGTIFYFVLFFLKSITN